MSVYLAAFNKSIADELQYRLANPNPNFRPNDQQKDVLLWGLGEEGSCNVIARAGCGKSSLLLELARYVDTRHYASTFHSIGLKIWRESRRFEIDGQKTKSLCRDAFKFDKKLAALLADAVSFGKLSGFGIPFRCPEGNETDWATLLDMYGIDDEITQVSPTRFISECMRVYKKSIEMCVQKDAVLDFDDMLLAPLYYSGGNKPPVQYDWVFVDEAQDTSTTRRMLAQWILKPGGRMVAVGDPMQSCYFFAGASSNAMDIIKAEMGSIELPLNVTYRCPSKIVAMAQTWVPDFTAHPSAPEGTIRTIDHTEFWLERFQTDGSDVILCRNRRPLVGIAMRLREAGIACVVEGQSGQALIGLATKWGEIPITDFVMKLEIYQEEQTKRWAAKERHDKVEALVDRCGILRSIAAKVARDGTTRKLVNRIEMLFGVDNRQDVLRLCTIHAGKGREWGRVFLIGRNAYQPSKYAETAEELQQETNLMYVAVTRVKEELVEVVVPRKKSAEEPEWWEL